MFSKRKTFFFSKESSLVINQKGMLDSEQKVIEEAVE